MGENRRRGEVITGCVPYRDVVGPPLLEEERPSDGADGVFKLPLRVPVEQRRLPHVHVPQDDHLHVGLLHLRHLGHGAGDAAGDRGAGGRVQSSCFPVTRGKISSDLVRKQFSSFRTSSADRRHLQERRLSAASSDPLLQSGLQKLLRWNRK